MENCLRSVALARGFRKGIFVETKKRPRKPSGRLEDVGAWGFDDRPQLMASTPGAGHAYAKLRHQFALQFIHAAAKGQRGGSAGFVFDVALQACSG